MIDHPNIDPYTNPLIGIATRKTRGREGKSIPRMEKEEDGGGESSKLGETLGTPTSCWRRSRRAGRDLEGEEVGGEGVEKGRRGGKRRFYKIEKSPTTKELGGCKGIGWKGSPH